MSVLSDAQAVAKTLKVLIGNNVTQTEIARRAGMSPGTLSLYVNGIRSPRDGNRKKLARGLGISNPKFEKAVTLMRLNPHFAEDPLGLRAELGLTKKRAKGRQPRIVVFATKLLREIEDAEAQVEVLCVDLAGLRERVFQFLEKLDGENGGFQT